MHFSEGEPEKPENPLTNQNFFFLGGHFSYGPVSRGLSIGIDHTLGNTNTGT